jgi:hypothetical protein
MPRRKFGREFEVEAVRLIRERGVSVTQAARDLRVHEFGATPSPARARCGPSRPRLTGCAGRSPGCGRSVIS